ncbi:MAG: hypothetical protein CMJ18_07875 [Phycisphaeraceae bacterium]|nr:hypothetical protein [Phycisphaeraceae bacterium]
MGQITSGVGLISGLPTADIIDQLMQIEERPKLLIEQRNAVLQSQQIAFQDVSAKLLALELSVSSFRTDRVFSQTSASTSNDAVLEATSTASATPGTYSFLVDRLVTTQQVITKGFADQDVNPIGAGSLTFEFGDARLDTDTEFAVLNGGDGVTRGRIRITDRSGTSAEIDLSRALTINDALEKINGAGTIQVTASISDDRLVLTDTSGSTTTNLAVSDVAGTSGTTASLGLDATAVGDVLTGNQINLIGANSSLTILNDNQGVAIQSTPNHFRIQTRSGATYDVDLTGATTIGDVTDAISTASGGVVTAEVDAAGTGLKLTDTGPDTGSTFQVTALNSSTAAADLGILLSDTNADGVIDGQRVIATLNSKLVTNLNGGSGAGLGVISITNRLGSSTNVDISTALSIQQIVDRINASGADVTAALNQAGNGLLLTDQTGSTASDLIIADVSGTAAVDLNLTGSYSADEVDSGNLQYQYISSRTALASLHGGTGISRGQFVITDSAGTSATVDLTQGNEVTIGDVLAEINSKGLLTNARINDNGDGILLEDTGPGIVKLKVEESGSTTAADLGLLGEATNAGDDLDGSFERTISVSATDTLEDVVQTINEAGLDVAATIINDGSQTAPFRINLTAERSGRAGAFVFDDGALDFQAATLSEGRNGVVFFGSSDPAKGIAITSSSNSLTTVIPGTTIDLKGTSDTVVDVVINRNDSAVTESAQSFVDNFNNLVDTINNYDRYDVETEERGLLLGDSTLVSLRGAVFRMVNSRNSELTGQFTTLAQIGITVGSGAKLEFDQARFQSALELDRDGVDSVFTFRETETDVDGNTVVTAGGIGARFEELLDGLTDGTSGSIQLRTDALQDQISLGEQRIEQIDDQIAAKRARLEAQFLSMERVLAQLQSQSSALASLQSLAPSSFQLGVNSG